MDDYFTFEVTADKTSGLMRRRTSPTGETLSYMNAAGAWVDDPGLISHWAEGDLVSVTAAEATDIAVILGGVL